MNSKCKNKPLNQNFISIQKKLNGQIETVFYPFTGIDSIYVGVALASATRVIARAFMDQLGLGEEHYELIQKQIAEIYNNDLNMGDLGEKETTQLK
jgi:hypothetical protein